MLPKELYQKLTDYDIRYYMYELLKVIPLFLYKFFQSLVLLYYLCAWIFLGEFSYLKKKKKKKILSLNF